MKLATQFVPRSIDILLVDDDEGDVLLTRKALNNSGACNSISVAKDGIEALAFLSHEGKYANAPRPDLILLDLNMPRMDGRETLGLIKKSEDLRSIPVVVLSTSDSEQDVLDSYKLNASCYVTKPSDGARFTVVVEAVKNFWSSIASLPSH